MPENEQHIATIRCHVGSNLRRFRKRLGMSQALLAQAAGLNRSYLSMVENGRRNISLDNLTRLALALKVEVVELLTTAEQAAAPAE